MNIDDEWSMFLNNNEDNSNISDNSINLNNSNKNNNLNDPIINDKKNIPKCGDIYISTKTKIIYLNIPFDIYTTFWKIPITNYDEQKEGILKKQIKISSLDHKEVENIEKHLANETFYYNKVLNHIDNPDGRVKFKDIRKISIGISSKDLIYSRIKDKSAFYNCFVIVLRILINDCFKEFHIKIFNTGKLEIPGLQNDDMLNIILNKLLLILKSVTNLDIYYDYSKIENVLINSNFNCGFYINREKLFNILRYKYNINACYDPCSYPGIQCVYYHNNLKEEKVKISYMIFRTGSILIVGKCDENELNIVYNFIKNILHDEYTEICSKNIEDCDNNNTKKKNKKYKKKIIYIN